MVAVVERTNDGVELIDADGVGEAFAGWAGWRMALALLEYLLHHIGSRFTGDWFLWAIGRPSALYFFGIAPQAHCIFSVRAFSLSSLFLSLSLPGNA